MTSPPVPPQAITAAARAVWAYRNRGSPEPYPAQPDLMDTETATVALEAARPHLAAAGPPGLNWEAVQVLSDWLDSEVAPEFKEQPLAQDWARISKVAEETGEAIAAFVGATGQNPRKGVTHSMDDVLTELADVALTGIYALAHFTGAAQAREVLAARQRRHHERIGLPFAAQARQAITHQESP